MFVENCCLQVIKPSSKVAWTIRREWPRGIHELGRSIPLLGMREARHQRRALCGTKTIRKNEARAASSRAGTKWPDRAFALWKMRRKPMTSRTIIAVASAALILTGTSSAFAQGTTGGTSTGAASSASPSAGTGSATGSEKMSGTDASTTTGSQKSSGNLGAPNAAGGAPTGGGGGKWRCAARGWVLSWTTMAAF